MLTALRTQYSVGNIVSDYAVPIGGISDFVVEVNDAVRERDSFELRQMNVARLQEMGVAKEEADAFLDSEVISPSVQTLMIGGLDRLGAIRGQIPSWTSPAWSRPKTRQDTIFRVWQCWRG